MGTVFIRGRYYSRVFIPVDLRSLIGRVEIRKSLRTTVYRDARILTGQWEGRLAELFTHLRCRAVSMTIEQIRRLVQAYIDSALEESEQSWLHSTGLDDASEEGYSSALADRLEDTAEQLQRNDFKQITKEVDALLQTHRRTLSKSSDAYLRLCREVVKARQYVLKRELDRLDGNYLNEFAEQRSTGERLPQPEMIRLISEALHDYFKHYSHRNARTNHEKQVIFTRFLDSLGGDRPLQEVTKADCIRFRDQYSRLPKRLPNDLRGKPLAAVLKATEKTDYLTVTKTTVNLALDDVRHFFSWAIKQDYYIGKNPVDGIAYEGTKQEHYDIFTETDLTAIFQSSEFIEQRTGKYPERYWLVLILALTGARREEPAQLRVDDVKHKEGVWFFDITDQEGKNEHSKRRVPVHSRLLELGFLDYLAMRKKQGPLLFPPTPKMKGRTTPGDAVGKWLSRLRKTVGVRGRKPLHSFRHTFITRLVSAGVPEDMRKVLVGHAATDVHGQTYTHREEISITLLQSHLEKLTLPV